MRRPQTTTKMIPVMERTNSDRSRIDLPGVDSGLKMFVRCDGEGEDSAAPMPRHESRSRKARTATAFTELLTGRICVNHFPFNAESAMSHELNEPSHADSNMREESGRTHHAIEGIFDDSFGVSTLTAGTAHASTARPSPRLVNEINAIHALFAFVEN